LFHFPDQQQQSAAENNEPRINSREREEKRERERERQRERETVRYIYIHITYPTGHIYANITKYETIDTHGNLVVGIKRKLNWPRNKIL